MTQRPYLPLYTKRFGFHVKEPLTMDGFEIERLGFERKEEEVEKIPMDFAPYDNNNVVAMM